MVPSAYKIRNVKNNSLLFFFPDLFRPWWQLPFFKQLQIEIRKHVQSRANASWKTENIWWSFFILLLFFPSIVTAAWHCCVSSSRTKRWSDFYQLLKYDHDWCNETKRTVGYSTCTHTHTDTLASIVSVRLNAIHPFISSLGSLLFLCSSSSGASNHWNVRGDPSIHHHHHQHRAKWQQEHLRVHKNTLTQRDSWAERERETLLRRTSAAGTTGIRKPCIPNGTPDGWQAGSRRHPIHSKGGVRVSGVGNRWT